MLALLKNFFLFSHPVADLAESNIKSEPESSVLKCKKNFKIWFSPRSRKVRCMVEKPPEFTIPEDRSSGGTSVKAPDTVTAQRQELSIFNFTSSSQDSGSSSTQKGKNEIVKKRSKNVANKKVSVKGAARSTQKQTKQMKKKTRLESINQKWGITEEASKEKEKSPAERPRRSSKKVSFLGPAVVADDRQLQETTKEVSPGRSIISSSLSGDITVLNDQTQPCQGTSESVSQSDRLPTNDPDSADEPEKQGEASPHRSSKRAIVEEKAATLETTPKRPRASPGRKRKSKMSPAVLNFPSSSSPRSDNCIKSSRPEQRDAPSVLGGQKSPCSHGASAGWPISGSPAVMKRNHKGESLLHVAAIKVELSE